MTQMSCVPDGRAHSPSVSLEGALHSLLCPPLQLGPLWTRNLIGGPGQRGRSAALKTVSAQGLAQRSQEKYFSCQTLPVCTRLRESFLCHMTCVEKRRRGQAQPQCWAFTLQARDRPPKRPTFTPAVGLREREGPTADSPRSRLPCRWLRGSRV